MNDIDTLRVSSHEHEIQILLGKYPKLTRTEVVQVIDHRGPMRAAVETELDRLSATKR
jgi:hypothetical protein